MRKLTYLLVLVFAISTAFKGDKRTSIKFDADKVSELLRDNEAIVSSNFPPEVIESAKHTWISPVSEDDKTMVLYSNQQQGNEANCNSNIYWFLEENIAKTTRYNSCKDGKTIQVEVDEKYSYSVSDRDNLTYLAFSDESGVLVANYRVKMVEKVKYTSKLSGYEITLTKE